MLKAKLIATHKASLDPKYTTFLKHFGEFRAAEVSERTGSSEAYILEILEGLTSSVNKIQNGLYKSRDSSVIHPASVGLAGELKDTNIRFSSRFVAHVRKAWTDYQRIKNVDENILRNESSRKVVASEIANKLMDTFALDFLDLVQRVDSLLIRFSIDVDMN